MFNLRLNPLYTKILNKGNIYIVSSYCKFFYNYFILAFQGCLCSNSQVKFYSSKQVKSKIATHTEGVNKLKRLKNVGQPTHDSHPYIIKPGEVTPLLTRNEFQKRRQALRDIIVQHLSEKAKAIKQHVVRYTTYLFFSFINPQSIFSILY